MKKITSVLMIIAVLAIMLNGLANCIYRNEQTLTTPSATTWVNTSDQDKHTFCVTTSGVSTNVVYQLEGSTDGIVTVNLDDSESVYTITSNVTKMYHKDNFVMPMMRLSWLSKSGEGTTPNIKISYIGGK